MNGWTECRARGESERVRERGQGGSEAERRKRRKERGHKRTNTDDRTHTTHSLTLTPRPAFADGSLLFSFYLISRCSDLCVRLWLVAGLSFPPAPLSLHTKPSY